MKIFLWRGLWNGISRCFCHDKVVWRLCPSTHQPAMVGGAQIEEFGLSIVLAGQGHRHWMPIKILHIITSLDTGGAERALYNILQGGLAESFDCHVVSLKDMGTFGPRIEALGVPVTCLGARPGLPSPMVVSRLKRVAREFHPDIVQGWMYHGNLAGLLARYFAPGRPVLAWNIRHSLYDIALEGPLTQLVIKAGRLLSGKPEKILYNSRVSRQHHEKFGFRHKDGQVIPNGIDVDRFRFSESARQRIRQSLDIAEDSVVIGHVARFHPMKDHRLFLKAATKVASSFSDVHFLMAGRRVEYQTEFFAKTLPADLRARFHLVGEREDVADLMCAMDIYSLSSSYGEGFSNVLGEAMSVGLPCVATDVGDCGLIIGDTGLLTQPRDLAGFGKELITLLEMPREERLHLGRRARARIVDNFSLSAIVEQYKKLYSEMILSNPSGKKG